jgi:hypothetical protein
MADTERAQRPTAPEDILTPAEIAEIQRAVREKISMEERRWRAEETSRKRRVPRWNPEIPWRPLEHTFIAALKGCNEISTRDLETILARGQVPMSGTRDDMIGEPAARIETLIAKASRRSFSFQSNSIWAMYDQWIERTAEYDDVLGITAGQRANRESARAAFFGPDSRLTRMSYATRWQSTTITFDNVKVNWPKCVEALQEAGFDICLEPKRAATAELGNVAEAQSKDTAHKPKQPAQKRRRVEPQRDQEVSNRIKTVLATRRRLWPNASNRPALHQQAHAIPVELQKTKNPPLNIGWETIRKILAGTYPPMVRLGIKPD